MRIPSSYSFDCTLEDIALDGLYLHSADICVSIDDSGASFTIYDYELLNDNDEEIEGDLNDNRTNIIVGGQLLFSKPEHFEKIFKQIEFWRERFCEDETNFIEDTYGQD